MKKLFIMISKYLQAMAVKMDLQHILDAILNRRVEYKFDDLL